MNDLTKTKATSDFNSCIKIKKVLQSYCKMMI